MTANVIVFDGGILRARPWTGVARAFLATLAAYARITPAECVLLITNDTADPRIDGVGILRTSAVHGRVARQLTLPRLLAGLRATLLHSPVAALPWRAPCPTIATVHDLPWRAGIELDEPGTGARHRLAVRVAVARAAAIVVPSQATRDALLREVGGTTGTRIQVIAHGVAPPPEPAPADALTGPFVAFGDSRPRKNIDRVRRAHAAAHRFRPDLPPLRWIGPGIEWLDDSERDAAVRSARALIAASLHEGFGLPVVEAFGHGVPVLCGSRGSLPEVAGGAALLVDPTDERALGDGMIRLHDDARLRSTLRALGLSRAADFTPERSAAGWITLHAECAA